MTDLKRRKALCLLGSGVALLAGCSESSGDDSETTDDETDTPTETDQATATPEGTDTPTETEAGEETEESEETETAEEGAIETGSIERGDRPAYASVLADVGGDEYAFGAVDFGTLTQLSDDSSSETETESEEPTDPLIVNPLAITFVGYFVLLGVGFSEHGEVFNRNDRTADDEGYALFAQETNLLVGRYDFDGMVAGFQELGYREITVEDDRAVFYNETDGQAIGFTETLFAYANEGEETTFDPAERVATFVDADRGDAPRKHETDGDFDVLLQAGDTDRVSFGMVATGDSFDEEDDVDQGEETDGPQTDVSPFYGCRGFHQHLDLVADESNPTASSVVTYPSEDAVDESALLDGLGTEAESVSFLRDGAAVRVDASYAGDEIEDGQSSLARPGRVHGRLEPRF